MRPICLSLSIRISTLEQNGEALLHGVFGFGANGVIVIIGDGVGDDHERIARHAGHLGHDLSCLGKSLGNDGGGGDARFFSRDGVVQTARRATASIPDRGDNGVALLHIGHDLDWRRTAGIGFFQAHHLRDTILRHENVFHVVEKFVHPDFTVVQQTDRTALEGVKTSYMVCQTRINFGGGVKYANAHRFAPVK
jgi:hypothetical protein